MNSFVKNNINNLNWSELSINPSAIPFLDEHFDKIDWNRLNLNPNALGILKRYPDKINWNWLSRNRSKNISIILEDYIFNHNLDITSKKCKKISLFY